MARDIPVGNGSLLVTFDTDYRIRDIYFPHVGQENHTAGHPCRFGFFVDGHFSWVGPSWRIGLDYADDTLMTDVHLHQEALALDVACRDIVDFHENVFLREVRVRNLADSARLIKAFFSHDFHLGESELSNTAFYDPQLQAVIHYRGPRYFLINVSIGGRSGVEEWAVGTKEFRGLEGTWRDAEDGRLECNPIAQGSLGSSWHPWYRDGKPHLPIQEDETALVLWALWRHFQRWGDVESLKPLYRPLIVAAAEFLEDYRDRRTGLPLPSYDLWEERWGVSTFTAGAVCGGLLAAASFAALFGQEERATRYRVAAEAVRVGMATHLFVPEANRFARQRTEGGVDLTVDASLYGAYAFGAFAVHHPMVRSTMAAVQQQLWVPAPLGGCIRYPGDTYQCASVEAQGLGNPWIICTLWLAQYEIEAAATVAELERAWRYLDWVTAHAQPSGVLPEQIHFCEGTAWSVTPLTWSHAEYIWTVRRLAERRAELGTPTDTSVVQVRSLTASPDDDSKNQPGRSVVA